VSVRRRVGIPIGLVTGSVLLTLAVLEVGLRLTSAPAVQPAAPPALPTGVRVLKDIRDLREPNVVGVLPEGVPYRTNAAGLRGRDYERPKPPGVFRIAVLGDSVAMGSGVKEEDTYAARIERALNDPPGPVTYEVLNLGIAGFNAGLVAQRLEQVGLSYEPDLVLYGYTLNDIEGPNYRASMDETNRIVGDLSREETARNALYVTTFFRTHFYSLRELVWPPRGSYMWELDDNYFDNPPAITALDNAFAEIEQAASARNACVVLLQHTNLWFLHVFHPFRRFHAAVAKLAAAHHFANKDTVSYFLGRGGLELWVGPFDPHPNAEGHAILARAALDALRDLPTSCWGPSGPPPALAARR
jgi:lysophospholipase L1-like esterase